MVRFVATMLALSAWALTSNAAWSATGFGSASFATERSCASVAAAGACDGDSLSQAIQQSNISGGLGLPSSSALVVGGDSASGAATFDAAGLPTLTASAFSTSGGDFRMNDNEVAFYSFTNTGPSAVALSPTAFFSFTASSVSPPGTAQAPDGGTLPNGALYSAFLAVVPSDFLGGATSPSDIVSSLFGPTCATPGVLAAGAIGADTVGGGASRSFGVSACGGGPLMVAPGATVLVTDSFQIPGNRGGFITDARLALTAAPEPAAWALMFIGVALAGSGLRVARRGQRRVSGAALG
jgi:hypothetical protein